MTTPRFPTANAVLRAARREVGTTEDPPGSNITKYGQAFGWPGEPWCGQFVWWCFDAAGVDLRRLGVQHPAFTPAFFAEAAKAGWVVEPDRRIQAGDVLFFDFLPPFDTTGIQHVGIATGRPVGGRVPTIEGNTSSGREGSQDNGGGVFARERGLDVIVAVVRPPYAGHPASATSRKVVRRTAAVVITAGAAAAVGNGVTHSPDPTTPATVVLPAPKPTASLPVPSPRRSVAPTPRRTPVPRPTGRPRRPKAPRPAGGVIVGPLGYGSTGPAVEVLQRHLRVLPTGYFGRVTLRKVRAAQATADIAVDGVVGPITARAFGLPYVPAARP